VKDRDDPEASWTAMVRTSGSWVRASVIAVDSPQAAKASGNTQMTAERARRGRRMKVPLMTNQDLHFGSSDQISQ
jgi:hypothetical protein